MDDFIPASPISPLRQRLIDDMTMREFLPRRLSYASRRPNLFTKVVLGGALSTSDYAISPPGMPTSIPPAR